MTKLCVLWLDPGKMTGWARLDGETFSSGEAPFYETGRIVRSHCTSIRYVSSPDVKVGYESFQVTPASYRMLGSSDALQAIGMIRWLALDLGASLLPPASRQARDTVTPAMLKALEWYLPGKGHANDAARHLVAWMMRSGSLTSAMRAKIEACLEEGRAQDDHDGRGRA
jgi:hypothetical protein